MFAGASGWMGDSVIDFYVKCVLFYCMTYTNIYSSHLHTQGATSTESIVFPATFHAQLQHKHRVMENIVYGTSYNIPSKRFLLLPVNHRQYVYMQHIYNVTLFSLLDSIGVY